MEVASPSSLLARQAKDRGWELPKVGWWLGGWEVKDWRAMYGGKADDMLVVGHGHQEAVSRARTILGILLSVDRDEEDRRWYNLYAAGNRAAIEEGLVEVAVPAWHPQFSKLTYMLSNPRQVKGKRAFPECPRAPKVF